MFNITEEKVQENRWMHHIESLSKTCRGAVREAKTTRENDEYVIYYDVLDNEFWSDKTMQKKYKNAAERIADRAAVSVVVFERHNRPMNTFSRASDFLFYQDNVGRYCTAEVRQQIWRVPWILMCDVYAREALRMGVPIADIVA